MAITLPYLGEWPSINQLFWGSREWLLTAIIPEFHQNMVVQWRPADRQDETTAVEKDGRVAMASEFRA